jgi:thiol-disulfide isomerase/thioredoxin
MTGIAARLAVLATASALALAACATSADPEAAPTSAAPAVSDTPRPVAPEAPEVTDAPAVAEPSSEPVEVPEALQFTATTLSGAEFDGASLAGQDAILWIWASWCPICQAEAPAVAAASEQLPDGVTLYGLPGNSDLASSQAFVADYGLEGFEHIFSEDGSLWSRFGVSYQPALVLINDDGTFDVLPGATGEAGIIKVAEDLAAN